MTAAPEEDVLAALDRVVREQRTGLARLARREGLNAEDAVDCVHDAFCTFLQLALRRQLPADPAEHAPLVSGIVRNAARNNRRRHHRTRTDPVGDAPGDEPSAEALVARAEDCVRLRVCVASLCENQRTVVMMRLLEERPGEDVASALGLGRGHVDVLLHRAKASLRVCMTQGDHRPSG